MACLRNAVLSAFLFVIIALPAERAHANKPLIPEFLPKEYLPPDFPNDGELDRMQRFQALETESRWEDIRGWRLLGQRWAAALDQKGNAIALYDLSYPTFFGRFKLGVVGTPGFDLRNVRELLRTAEVKEPKSFHTLAKLSKIKPETNLLPEGWWRKVPWRGKLKAALALDDAAPARFSLGDIDFESVATFRGLFRKAMKYLEENGVRLADFEFAQRAGGGYEIFWNFDPTRTATDLNILFRPKKIADMNAIHAGFVHAIGHKIVMGVIGLAIGQIPIPVVSALLGTALSRYFAFEGEVLDMHQEMALEMISIAAEGGAAYSPFAPLRRDELQHAGSGIILSQLNLFNLWDWITRGAAGMWRRSMTRDLDRARDSLKWIRGSHENEWEFNPRFAMQDEAGAPRRLYLLSRYRLLDKSRPEVAIDYRRPDAQLIKRVAVESASIIVDFASRFIPLPLVGGIVSSLFDMAVRDPVQNSKKWEARLAVHLEERMATGHEDWNHELDLLEHQRVNPLELPRSKVPAMVALRRKEMGF